MGDAFVLTVSINFPFRDEFQLEQPCRATVEDLCKGAAAATGLSPRRLKDHLILITSLGKDVFYLVSPNAARNQNDLLADCGVPSRCRVVFVAPDAEKPLKQRTVRPKLRDRVTKGRPATSSLGVSLSNAFAKIDESKPGTSHQQAILSFIDRNARELLRSQMLFERNQQQMLELLSRDTLCVSEVDVIEALCRWAQHRLKEVSGTSYSSWRDILSPTPVLEGKEQENAPKARSLLEVIRFPVLDPLQVANHVAPYRLLRSKELAALFTYVVVRKEREIQICNTNEEDRETSQIIPSPKLPVCLVRFNSRPRLSKFGLLDLSIESSDGGEYSSQYKPSNLLKDNEEVYCSAKAQNVNILLRSPGGVFKIDQVTAKTPSQGYTNPLSLALVFILDNPDQAAFTSKFDDFTATQYKEYLNSKEREACTTVLPSEPVCLINLPDLDHSRKKFSVDFSRVGSFILLKLISSISSGDDNNNIDVQMVLFEGYSMQSLGLLNSCQKEHD